MQHTLDARQNMSHVSETGVKDESRYLCRYFASHLGMCGNKERHDHRI